MDFNHFYSTFSFNFFALVQPGAEINTVDYCEQGLLPTFCHLSNNNFPISAAGAPAHRSCHTITYMCSGSNVPEFTEPEN